MKQLMSCLILFLCFGHRVSAQDESWTLPSALNRGDVLITRNADRTDQQGNVKELWLLDPFFGTQSLYLNLERTGYRMYDISITEGGKYLFALQVEDLNNTGFVHLGESELIRLDLETGERGVLFSGENFVHFRLSNNATKALIQFYPEDATYIDRYDLQLEARWCVVAFNSDQNECRELTFEDHAYPSAFEWLSNDLLTYTLNDTSDVYILDTNTFITTVIELPDETNASAIRAIPDTNNLLIYDSPLSQSDVGMLLLLDVSTASVSAIGELNYPPTYVMEVSPDGDLVAMAGIENTGILVNLQTGVVIQTYPTIYDLEWTSFHWLPTDSTTFLIGSLRFKGNNVMTVVFEPFTNTVVNILPQMSDKLIVVP